MRPATVDPHIKYTPGNHFDLTQRISVKEGDRRKTLIGVVNGMKIYRSEYRPIENVIVFHLNCLKACTIAVVPKNFTMHSFFIK
ncbi:hypothetical protein L596_025228 [Steinernema carpocapsae]|uniref:Uncharacterized protein n=1 Tax=Steinernema carpocapsae TaxID=34508 RepID=A0A4U5M767_STECR|nr:hypothetical protein L596_025228 [Steinernema carpocapsae]